MHRRQFVSYEDHVGHYQQMQRWSQVWYDGAVMTMTILLTAKT